MIDLFDPIEAEPAQSQAVTLREYQERIVTSVFAELETNRSTLVVAATGTGKTTIFCEVISRNKGRALVLAHRKELIEQAAQRLYKFGLDVEIEMADLYAAEYRQPRVIVASVQTLMDGRMERFNPGDFSLIVIDEAHHAPAGSYKKIVKHFCQNPEQKILGVTATPDRADEEALGQMFDTVACVYEINDAIDDGYLVPIKQVAVEIGGLDFSQIDTTAGDLNGGQLAELMEREAVMHGVASATIELSEGRKTLVFCESVKQSEDICEILNRHQPKSAEWVCGKTHKQTREEILHRYRRGQFKYLVNCGVFTEGFDEPAIEVIAQARPTKARSLYSQIAGRGTRTLPGVVDGIFTAEERREAIANSAKPHLLVIDFVGNSGKHKLICATDILGGNFSDEEIAQATLQIRKSGKPADVAAELEKARKEVEERKLKEAAKRAKLVAKASFKAVSVDPFDVFQLRPQVARGWDRVKKPSDKMLSILASAGLPTEVTFTQARQLVGEIFRRRELGLCTAKQIKMLRKYNYDAREWTFAQASDTITKIANNNWRRPE